MTHHTEPAAAVHQRYDDLIAEAEAAAGILPPIDDCRRLARELRAAIRDLAERVRARQDHLPQDDDAWRACEAALLAAQAALCGGLGLGLRSAALHVSTLGGAARRLADVAAEA
jgi:hypothetical protein